MSTASPLDELIAAAKELAGEVGSLVPRLVARSRDQIGLAGHLLERLGCLGDTQPVPVPAHVVSPAKRAPAKRAPAKKAPANVVSPAERAPARKAPARKAPAKKAPAGVMSGSALPIAGYDTLAASQIIARLDGLTPTELAAVKSHELTNRGRRTVLGRIGQLEG